MNKIILSIIILFSFVQFGKAQIGHDPNVMADALNNYNNNLSPGSARYLGMGESMGALGGDLGAMDDNPAATGVFNSFTIAGTIGLNNVKNTAKSYSSNSNTETNFNFNNFGGVYSFPLYNSDFKNINLGINYNYERLDNDVVFGYNDNVRIYDEDDNLTDYKINNLNQHTKGYRNKVGFNLASNYDDKIYFGAGLNWHYLSIDRDSYVNINDKGFIEESTPYSQDANGFSMSIGVIGKVTENFRLGLAYSSPIWWSDIKMDWDEYDEKTDNYEYYIYDKNKINAPGKIMGSVAYIFNLPSANDNHSLAMNFDVINNFNGNFKFKPNYDNANQRNNYFVSNYIKNNQEYRGGLEYRYDIFRLRAGYGYTNSPIKNNSILGTDTTTNTERYVKNYLAGNQNKFSIGLGLDFGEFFTDFAFQHIKTDYYTVFSGAYGNDLELMYIGADKENVLGKVEKLRNNFLLTLGWRF